MQPAGGPGADMEGRALLGMARDNNAAAIAAAVQLGVPVDVQNAVRGGARHADRPQRGGGQLLAQRPPARRRVPSHTRKRASTEPRHALRARRWGRRR